jgi:glucosamine-6-phosphate deaminase
MSFRVFGSKFIYNHEREDYYMKEFTFSPAPWVPFRDKEALERVRNMTRDELEKHPNPDFKIKIVPNYSGIVITDMVMRMKHSDDYDETLVMIIPNPDPAGYMQVAELVNYFKINCRNVHIFSMDEWADEDGNIAPPTYKSGFTYSFLKYFVYQIDESLRMPMENVHYPTNENAADYSKMIEDIGNGGADISYGGPGWSGHVAFVDPLTPEFETDSVEEFIEMGARIVTLHPLTIIQNSLHGVFGQSGDLANVPPKAFTVGPRDIKNARNRILRLGITTSGTFSSWQRMIGRLVLHGPVTPLVPSSIMQLWPTRAYVTESLAAPIQINELAGY